MVHQDEDGSFVTDEGEISVGPAKRGEAPAALPSVAGYEILGVLGRGGMGVVYKARQEKLNRLVALKMVLAGAHASAEQLARFYTEAEAVARLQHPNIVQIFDVGEFEGLPFFSLEYVDGGTLASKIAGKPQPPREAAETVEQLAYAMAAAHERGIIHRDLKPANVLLSRDGLPKITDFGLAKRIEDDSSQTKSGTLMGTPSYMSPEQARLVRPTRSARSPTCIPWAPFFTVIFLTGRPPFVGLTMLETMLQVRTQEPVPPTRLQPKCLALEPRDHLPEVLAKRSRISAMPTARRWPKTCTVFWRANRSKRGLWAGSNGPGAGCGAIRAWPSSAPAWGSCWRLSLFPWASWPCARARNGMR